MKSSVFEVPLFFQHTGRIDAEVRHVLLFSSRHGIPVGVFLTTAISGTIVCVGASLSCAPGCSVES